MINTQYFTFIFDPETTETAQILAEHADAYAQEIAAKLDKKLSRKISVFIRSDSENLSGYFVRKPYQRIILFNAGTQDNLLGNFKDTMLKVFYHELTHAISLNYILPLLPTLFTEGVAVSFESNDGVQGRLHDPLAQHYLIQNRIDNTSPTWKQAFASQDVYPFGIWPYLYGAEFAQYLQKTYGMEQYAKLFQSSWKIFINQRFKSIFNKPVWKAWEEFLDTIPVPANLEEAIPVTADSMSAKGLYEHVAASKNMLAYYDMDRQKVVAIHADYSYHTLFSQDRDIQHLHFSADGTKLIVSDSLDTWEKTVQRVRIFDLETGSFLPDVYTSASDAEIFPDGIVLLQLEGTHFKLVFHNAASKKEELLFEASPRNAFSALYNPVFIDDHTVGFIAANGLDRKIMSVDLHTKETRILAQDLFALRYLQSQQTDNGTVLSFAWAKKGGLYRAGVYDVQTKSLSLLDKDISGGVFYPVLLPQETQPVIGYVGIHHNYMQWYQRPLKEFTTTTVSWQAYEQSPQKKLTATNIPVTAYKPGKFFFKPRITPSISLPENKKKIGQYGFGLKLRFVDPTELVQLSVKPLFYFYPFFMSIDSEVQFHLRNMMFSIQAFDTIESRTFDYRRSGFSLGMQVMFPTTDQRQKAFLSTDLVTAWFAPTPRNSKSYVQYYHGKYEKPVTSLNLLAGWSFFQSTAYAKSNFFAKNTFGVSIAAGGTVAYAAETKTSAIVTEAKTEVKLPYVPLTVGVSGYFGWNAGYAVGSNAYRVNGYNITPRQFFGIEKTMMPSTSSYGSAVAYQDNQPYYTGLGIDFDLTVFSYNIQSGNSLVPLFFNRIQLDLGYAGLVNTSISKAGKAAKPQYFDMVKGSLILTVNSKSTFGVRYTHPLRIKKKFGKIDMLVNIVF